MEINKEINHSRFGTGIVTAIDGENVTVQFEMFGAKTIPAASLVAATAPLSTEVVTREISKSGMKKWAAREMVITDEQAIAAQIESWGSSKYKMDGDAAAIIFAVSGFTGFAADVAKTCLKYGKVSPKQAAIIAKAYVNR